MQLIGQYSLSFFKNIRTTLWATVILVIGMTVVLRYLWLQEVEDTHNVPTVANLTVKELMKQFSPDNVQDLEQYIDQAIEVSGFIKEVSSRNNRTTILLQDNDFKHLVLCELQDTAKEKITGLEPGQEIRLKGIYKGALMDVILLNCIILGSPDYD